MSAIIMARRDDKTDHRSSGICWKMLSAGGGSWVKMRMQKRKINNMLDQQKKYILTCNDTD